MDHVPSPTPRRRAALVLALVLALVAAPAIVLAAHQFSDVPDSNPFHDEISMLADSGVTLGCGGGKFCPRSSVTREQMAAFMTRGMGYATVAAGALPISESATTYLAVAELPAGGATGGSVYVTVSADVSLVDFVSGCPCAVIVGVENLDTGEIALESLFVVGSETVDGGSANTGSVHWVFQVPSGTTAAFGLYADVFTETVDSLGTNGVPAPEEPLLTGNLVAEYSPFGATLPFPEVTALEVPSGWAGQRSTQERVPPR